MEQVAFDIRGAVEEIQQLQLQWVDPQSFDHHNDDDDEEEETSTTSDSGGGLLRGDNDNDAAALRAVKIRNGVRRCLRELDKALGRLIELTMVQEQEQELSQSSFRSDIVRPMLRDLVIIVAELDLRHLGVQEGNPNYMIYQSVFQKSILCLRDYAYILQQEEAVKAINRVLLMLYHGLTQGIHYFARPVAEIERVRGLLSLLNDTMGVKQQEKEKQGRGSTNDMEGSHLPSCFEEVLGGNFDTLDLLENFLNIAIDCLQDEKMREARATSIPQNDVQEGNKVRVQTILTFVDFLLMHVNDSMANCQSRTMEEYFWTLKDDQEHDNDDKEVDRLSKLLQTYSSELIGAAFDEIYAAISLFEVPCNVDEEEDASNIVGNDGDGSTGNSNSSRKEEYCAKSTPSSITTSLSSRSNATDNSVPKGNSGGGLRVLDAQNASLEVAKMASYPLFVCTVLQVIGGDRGVLDPVKLKEIQSLWVSYTKLFLEVKKYQAADTLPLSDEATMAGTDAMIRLGVLAMADIISANTEAKEVTLALDPEVLYVVSISLLAAIEFPQLLVSNTGSGFLAAVGVVTVQNSEMRHLIQGATLRELVFPTNGSTRDPLAMTHVTTKLIEILKISLKSCEAKGTLDRWDCFYRDQLAKQQQGQEQSDNEVAT